MSARRGGARRPMTVRTMNVQTLGEARFPSRHRLGVGDDVRIPERIECGAEPGLAFEVAGPRARLFFDPPATRAGIVTCGGLCPGINNVIRSLYLELHHGYGVAEVIGFRDGYQGLDPAAGREPVVFTRAFVHDIHRDGGTVLGTSRGPVDVGVAVDDLARRKVDILFAIGGDGTQRGAAEIHEEARRRGLALAVVGVPKTIDNDIPFVSRTFGYLTAVEEASEVLACAHTEATSVPNGISLVKLMGRHAGFITAGATIASQDVNFALIPEVPFALGPFLAALRERMLQRGHALIAVAEGAGQELLASAGPPGRDASGNVKLGDIGPLLRRRIEEFFAAEGMPVVVRYFDPSYQIRSVPVTCEDALLCDHYARNAAHAALAGKTGMIIGFMHERFIHVPVGLLADRVKRLDPTGAGWRSVLAATGQPERFTA